MAFPICICVGDSITQLGWRPDGGYVAALAHEYHGRMDVINRGYGGYSSHQIVAKLKDNFFSGTISRDSDVRLIVLNIGTNDSVERGPSKKTGLMRNRIHIDEYNRNLIEIQSIFQITYPKARILVLAPSIASFDAYKSFQLKSGIPDVDIQRADFDRSNESAKIYRDACLATAASNGKVVVIDTLKLHQDAMERSQLGENDVVEDGVHFSGLGYQIVWNEMKQVIATHWSDLDPEQMSQCFVQWDEYAGGDPRPLPEDI